MTWAYNAEMKFLTYPKTELKNFAKLKVKKPPRLNKITWFNGNWLADI